jgi:CheY-like chemotaxis protein/two-component sensor histidine kinase
VTERSALQAQLARADRLSALGTLAAGVAHEINNPLTFLSLGVDAVERLIRKLVEPAKSPRLHELLHEIRHGATRVAAIVRELNAYSRFDEEARGPVDLTEILSSAERLVAHQLRGRALLRVEFRDPPKVLGNAGRLEQVFVNLLMNAVQSFTEDATGKRVEVVARRAPNGFAVVEVRDDGPGIPKELLGRVFDPFFTTKPPGVGTGLGLSICHRIVTQLGGEIAIESDRGTVVRVTLPPAIEDAAVVSSQPRALPELRRRRLLVIDDEPALVLTLRCLLEQDHDVVTLTDGREALRRILEDPPYDLVLCDLAMPGLDGADLYEQVRGRRPEVTEKFVFMTGGAYTEKTSRFIERAARPCLQKPFPIAEIEALLRR